MIEYERTYLAASVPADLASHSSMVIDDLYIPESSDHPVVRLRRSGDSYELTKKQPQADASEQTEDTIVLDKPEYDAIAACGGKRVRKTRYTYPWEHGELEFDVFTDELKGLVLIDAEFSDAETKGASVTPPWALSDVTHEDFVAGGMLCAKSYADIQPELERFGYTPLEIE